MNASILRSELLILFMGLVVFLGVSAARADDVSCWVLDTMSTVTPETAAPKEAAALTAEVDLARREAEGFQVIIRSEKADLKNVRLDTAGFPLKVEWYAVGYTKADKGKKRMADMLL